MSAIQLGSGPAVATSLLRREGDDLWLRVSESDWRRLVDAEALGLGEVAARPLAEFSPLAGDEPLELRLAPRDAGDGAWGDDGPDLNAAAWVAVEVRQPVELPPDLAASGGEVHVGARRRVGDEAEEASVVGSRSEPLFDVVRGLLDGLGAEYEQMGSHPVLQVSPEGDNGSWQMFIEVREDEDVCVAYSTWQGEVPTERRDPMLRLVNRLNGEQGLGAFVLDFDSGVVSYRTGLDVARGPLSAPLLSRVLLGNIEVFDDCLPAIEAVAAGGDPETTTVVRRS